MSPYNCCYKFLFLLPILSNYISGNPISEENELSNELSCKELCAQCGSLGFYCGQECICETKKDNYVDINCISRIQNTCHKMKFPFEVLIQGSSGSRFMVNALSSNVDNLKLINPESRNKRHTLLVYKPVEEDIYDKSEFTIDSDVSKSYIDLENSSMGERQKRAINRLAAKERKPKFLNSFNKRNAKSTYNFDNNNDDDDDEDWFNDVTPKQQQPSIKTATKMTDDNNHNTIQIKQPLQLPFLRRSRQNSAFNPAERIQTAANRLQDVISALQDRAQKLINAATTPSKFALFPRQQQVTS